MSGRIRGRSNVAAAGVVSSGQGMAGAAPSSAVVKATVSGRPSSAASGAPASGGGGHETRAKTVLKEAVDAVVNSFAKHTQGYGRGEESTLNLFF